MNLTTGKDLAAWRSGSMKITQATLADCLGVSRQTIVNLENSEKKVPKQMRLACAALAIGLRDYNLGGKISLEIKRLSSKGVHGGADDA